MAFYTHREWQETDEEQASWSLLSIWMSDWFNQAKWSTWTQQLLWRRDLLPCTAEHLRLLLYVCQQLKMPLPTKKSAIAGITFHENHATHYTSLTINYSDPSNPVLLTHYPDTEACKTFLEFYRKGFWVCFNMQYGKLHPEILQELATTYHPTARELTWPDHWLPFCCKALRKRDCRRLQHDYLFTSLLEGHGHWPAIVFEVKKYPLRGPQLMKRYFQILNNTVAQVRCQGHLPHKVHTFRNYICHTHKHVFAVDIYQAIQVPGQFNFHHMRLVPFTHYNAKTLTDFLYKMLPQEVTINHPFFHHYYMCDA
eukprot:Blabericola_migrator_1__414@NODE_10_length_25093_cov_104_131184_g7_i2_p10_GENE_NODE_10_length_25093_cov_104_131184_g7_i2NODE_10_length_25093_cov_104_131184_g7_i2_p10_ORF_typecomplete_len311_score34_70L51_S25_CIB8/PF05047_16/1_3e03L51_S25_CIB8/PF05047_16/0_25_NODE_10_length_25093_cov_104_131184_g7_i2964910581